MTENQARAALAAFDGLGGLERWIAEQRPWQALPAGWTVMGGGVRLIASAARPGRVGSGRLHKNNTKDTATVV